ncbi:helix-turn-helix domain-containing protein [bacterium]|nr:helix-turn-helix domain-containing protein [bacterium]
MIEIWWRLTNRIKELRDKKRMKQSVLAEKVGVFQSEISEIETGNRIPNVYLALKIAKVLGERVEEVFLL